MATMTTRRNINIDGLQVQTDLHQLKELSNKLNLATRRPSVVQWKQVIEYRKARGQYVSSSPPQYLDNMMTQRLKQESTATVQSTSTYEAVLDNTDPKVHVTAGDFHRQLFAENINTPTKMTSDMDGITPTPTRRVRRYGRTAIPECDEAVSLADKAADVANNNTPGRPEKMAVLPETSNVPLLVENPTKNENTEDVSARYRRVGQMFEKLRRDLVIMRIEDNKLARKLLDVRSEMNLVRAQKSCAEHADMLDDVTIELEEEEELTGLIKACDLSQGKPTSLLSAFSPLRNIGVSRMNLNRRRFSIR
uniref:uncharacterized protein LOC100183949 n=1 Tax=Ciona intestinalis TaxID=7719 RepID=UPI00006A3AEA|nr:uncharacterized protein LOC100183949 [Ciona intestinalis]|eukprot:XP_002129856.1 uncharacterized protein LOC100183949 [Ciona intestinalis]